MTDQPTIQLYPLGRKADPKTGTEADAFQVQLPTGETLLMFVFLESRVFTLELVQNGHGSGSAYFDIPDAKSGDTVREFVIPDTPASSISDRITIQDFAALVEFVRHRSKDALTNEPEL